MAKWESVLGDVDGGVGGDDDGDGLGIGVTQVTFGQWALLGIGPVAGKVGEDVEEVGVAGRLGLGNAKECHEHNKG